MKGWKDYNVGFRFTFKIGAAFELLGVCLQLVMTRITDFMDSNIRLSIPLITSFWWITLKQEDLKIVRL